MSRHNAKKIFLAAIELESFDDREAFLKEACGGDDILRQRVDALIFAHERPESLLEHAAPKLDEGPSSTQTVELSDGEDPNATVPSDSQTEDRSQQNTSSPPSRTRVHYFGDYELLQEIARGGMGVVYKARQVTLNRTVAIKMILAGQLASPEEVQRFHAEAEAAATLDHPAIVPIHEVGTHDAQHYFSMAFVDGPSLAEKLQSGPLTPAKAAALTKKIAEAVVYAHEHGVIHRDLKPANVLLDSADEPRITDFGLAKKAEVDAGLTVTGQVLGTPSYMSPEQAAAEADRVGKPSDIYSLGAILYASLTGRAPFEAATMTETLMQVLEQEPLPPSQLEAGTPRELEVICLKCLAKDPRQRYSSAQELVEDLERFLKGERIVAKRRQFLVESRAIAVGWSFAGLVIGVVITRLLGYEFASKNTVYFVWGGLFGMFLAATGINWNVMVVPFLLLCKTKDPLAKVSLGIGVLMCSLACRVVHWVANESRLKPENQNLIKDTGVEPFPLLPAAEFFVESLSTIGAILAVLAPILCLSLPAKSRTHGLLHADIVLSLFCLVIEQSTSYTDLQVHSLLALKATSAMVFFIFLRRLAQFLDCSKLARKAWWLIVATLLLISTAALNVAANHYYMSLQPVGDPFSPDYQSYQRGPLFYVVQYCSFVVAFSAALAVPVWYYRLTRTLQLTILKRL